MVNRSRLGREGLCRREQKQVSSADYRGKWQPLLVPARLHVVCPTEIRVFQSLSGEFKDDGVAVIGVSVSTVVFSHKQWFADRKTFPEQITHPWLADTNTRSAAHSEFKEDRAWPTRHGDRRRQGIILVPFRVNDLSVGRSPKEVLRTVQELQSGGLAARMEEGRGLRRLSMGRVEKLEGERWRELIRAPLAVLVLGKSDCEACSAWSRELEGFLEQDEEWRSVRFGKILLDERGLVDFKRANPWIAELDVLPFTQIYVDGERSKSFAGGGIERLVNAAKLSK